MTLDNWPKNERPREKLLLNDAQMLSNAELLAIILGSGTKGTSAVDLAHLLLNTFNSLREIFNADFKTLSSIKGIGNAKYCLLQSARELGKRLLEESLQNKPLIQSVDDVELFLRANLRDLKQEVFACLFLDNQHHIIAFEKLFFGSIRSANVHPREVIKRALHHNAAAIIVTHNHPCGAAEPSFADKEITKELFKALELVEIDLLDHIIIGDNQYVSLAESGFIFDNVHKNK